FPGSGNDFAGMGREIAMRWPAAMRRQELENSRIRDQFAPDLVWNVQRANSIDARAAIFGQVTVGALIADVLALFGVRPRAAIGYSLGESAALFALRAWTARDEMYRRMQDSSLFVTDLTGPCNAARAAWRLTPQERVDWLTGVIGCSADRVRGAIRAGERVYL